MGLDEVMSWIQNVVHPEEKRAECRVDTSVLSREVDTREVGGRPVMPVR